VELTEEQERFKAEYIRDRGYWVPFNDGLLAHAPEFLRTYFDYAALPARTGPLSLRMRELIYVAVDTSTTHMFGQGLAIHIRGALKAGCTPGELMEVMELATAQGLDSVSSGIGLVLEEIAAAGQSDGTDERPLSAAETALRQDFEARFGDWPRWCDQLVRRDPDYFAAMTKMLDGPSLTGGLDAKTKSIIAFALAAAPTHLNRDGMREHARRAIRHGATAAELIEVLQLVAHLGVHACVIGVPLIVEESAAA
jgi:alkylhydroperoxidase/carboxymuconolactone decarboxylase family protein YurZ